MIAPIIEAPVPRDKYKIISSVHNSIAGHWRIDKPLERLKELGHDWPDMLSHVVTFIHKHCAICQKLSIQKTLTNVKRFKLPSYDSTGVLPRDGQETAI